VSRLRSFTEFFGLRRSIVGLLTMAVLVGMGERMAETFLPLYVLALGGWMFLPGLLNGMDNLLSALYSFPGGYLAEKLGIKRSLLIFNAMAVAGYVVVIAIPSWPAVFAGSVLFLSWTSISLPATMGLVAKALPKNKQVMGVTVHSLVRWVPMAAGPVIGGLFIARFGLVDGVRLAFVAALAMAAVAAIAQQVLIESDRREAKDGADAKASPEKNPFRAFRRLSPALRSLLVADILVRFCEQIPYAYVAVWAVRTISNPVSEFDLGVLRAVEMGTAMLIYVPVAYLADRAHKKPFVLMTFAFFTAFPLVLLFSRSFWALVGAFVVRGFKEFGEPTRKALIMELAPENAKASTFGTYYLFRDVIVSLAALASGFLWMIAPEANLLTAFVFGVAGTLWFVVATPGSALGRTEGAVKGRSIVPGRPERVRRR